MDNTGTSTAADGFAEAYSLAALYSNGPFFASFAWERLSEELVEEVLNASAGLQPALSEETRWRLGLGYTANGLHAGFVYENQEHALTGLDADRWQISGSYTMGNNVIKAMYGENEVECSTSCLLVVGPGGYTLGDGSPLNGSYSGVDVRQWALGVDHNFSKRTKAYVVYTDVDVDQQMTMGPNDVDGSWDGFSLGLVHSF
jgi:predicted porin